MNRTRFNQGNIFNDLLDEIFAPIVNERAFGKKHNGKRHHPHRKDEFRPAVNILEGATGYHIELATPGFKKENFNIKIEKDQLIISGKKETPAKDEKEGENESSALKFTRREFNFAKFQRSFHLPEDLDKDGIEANYENGILTIAIPKAEQIIERAKVISVS